MLQFLILVMHFNDTVGIFDSENTVNSILPFYLHGIFYAAGFCFQSLDCSSC